MRRWRRCLPRTQSPASRPATPCKSVETSRPRRWWHRSQEDEAGSTAKRAWRPAASGAGGTARRRMRLDKAGPGALSEGSSSISDESPSSSRGAAASILAEDPAQVFRDEVLSSLLNAERPRRVQDPAKGLTSSAPCLRRSCVPPQPRGDVANATIDVCGRQRGRDGRESPGATP